MRILIFGLSKSGTTALWTRLCKTLPDHAQEFERFDDDASPNLVRKQISNDVLRNRPVRYKNFDKRIWLCRDPRDNLISYLLYILAFHTDFEPWDITYLLKQKSEDPSSISVEDLVHTVQYAYPRNMLRYTESVAAHSACSHDFFLSQYYDIVTGRLEDLEDYLGFRLTEDTEVYPCYSRVVRTKWHSSWKRWFVRSDVDHFRPLLKPYMDHFGYADHWDLDPNPVITPAESWEYFQRVRAEKDRIAYDRTRDIHSVLHQGGDDASPSA